MKKMLSIGVLISAITPICLVIACSSGNDTNKINQNTVQTKVSGNTINESFPWTKVGENNTINSSPWTKVDENNVISKPSKNMFVADFDLDRSGKVINVSRDIDWNVEEYSYPGTPPHIIKADIYHTALFDYVVQKNYVYENSIITSKTIERLAKIFEANTIIGSGHYDHFYNSKNQSICKNEPIQFISGGGWNSSGGVDGVTMTTAIYKSGQITSSEDLIPDSKILNEAELMMHEYGHHETMVSATNLINGHTDSNMFQKFVNDLNSDDLLKIYSKFFNKNTPPTGTQSETAMYWSSPWGFVKEHTKMWAKSEYGYIFSAPEFITRFLSLMEGNISPENFKSEFGTTLGQFDALAMHDAFWQMPYENQDRLEHMIDLYKKDIFAFDQKLGGDKSHIGYIDTKGTGPMKEVTFSIKLSDIEVTKAYLSTFGLSLLEQQAMDYWFNDGAKPITFSIAKDSFDKYPVEYRLNKSINNGIYDSEMIKGYYYCLNDRPKFENDKINYAEVLGSALAKLSAHPSAGRSFIIS